MINYKMCVRGGGVLLSDWLRLPNWNGSQRRNFDKSWLFSCVCQIAVRYHATTKVSELSPHIYGVAERAYRALICEQKPQCCVISGESGAGKTESSKYLVQHLLSRAVTEETNLNLKIQQVESPFLHLISNKHNWRKKCALVWTALLQSGCLSTPPPLASRCTARWGPPYATDSSLIDLALVLCFWMCSGGPCHCIVCPPRPHTWHGTAGCASPEFRTACFLNPSKKFVACFDFLPFIFLPFHCLEPSVYPGEPFARSFRQLANCYEW